MGTSKRRTIVAIARWLGFLGLVNWVLFAFVFLHWVLIMRKCVISKTTCYFVLTEGNLYGNYLLYIGLCSSIAVLIWLEYRRRRNEEWRMRYAAGVIALIVISAGYFTAYFWDGLNGGAPPSTTIRDMGFAVAAVLTLLFVIWRERIASNQAEVKLSDSLAGRFQNGAQMLSSKDPVERIAGISAIRELGRESSSPGYRNDEYYSMSLNLLCELHRSRNPTGSSETEESSLQEAIRYLKKQCSSAPRPDANSSGSPSQGERTKCTPLSGS